MIRSIEEIRQEVQKNKKAKIVIAAAGQEDLKVAYEATKQNLAEFILIGDQAELLEIIKNDKFSDVDFVIYNEVDPAKAVKKAVAMVHQQEADFPMKGSLHTGTFLREILHKERGLGTDKLLSQITVFDGYNQELQYLTDCAINIAPDLNQKIKIIENAVEIAHKLGNPKPLVAMLGSLETVNPAMADTLDSAILTQMNRRGQIKNCLVDGPLALDNAVSLELATIKGIDSPVAGKAQILVAPDLGLANSLSKALTHYAKLASASVVAGTQVPIVMTSRTDTLKNKLAAVAIASYLARREEA